MQHILQSSRMLASIATGGLIAIAAGLAILVHVSATPAMIALGALAVALSSIAVLGVSRTLIIGAATLTMVSAHLMPIPEALALSKVLALSIGISLVVVAGLRRSSGLLPLLCTITLGWAIGAALLSGASEAQISQAELVRSAIGYGYAWVFVGVVLQRSEGIFALRVLAWSASASVALGLVLTPLLGRSVVRFDSGAPRLQGALTPAHLALLAFVGLGSSLWLLGVVGANARLAIGANLLIIVSTGTRGASVAALLTLAVYSWRGRRHLTVAQKRLAMAIGVIGVLAFVPILLERSAAEDYGGTAGINASGRSTAWPFYYEQFTASPMLGHGLGFSAVAVERLAPEAVQSAFRAPHNSYLQLLVDGGVLVGGLLAISVGVVIYRVWRGLASAGRRTLTAFLAGSAVYALVDNLLSTPQFTLPFALFLSCAWATGRLNVAGERAGAADREVLASDATLR